MTTDKNDVIWNGIPLRFRDIVKMLNDIEADIVYISESKNMLEIRRICEDIICSLASVKNMVLEMTSLIRGLAYYIKESDD